MIWAINFFFEWYAIENNNQFRIFNHTLSYRITTNRLKIFKRAKSKVIQVIRNGSPPWGYAILGYSIFYKQVIPNGIFAIITP